MSHSVSGYAYAIIIRFTHSPEGAVILHKTTSAASSSEECDSRPPVSTGVTFDIHFFENAESEITETTANQKARHKTDSSGVKSN